MELLSRLCNATMPCHLSDEDEIEKLSVLRAAQLVETEIPPIWRTAGRGGFQGRPLSIVFRTMALLRSAGASQGESVRLILGRKAPRQE
jgi:hypothetical protein